MTLLTGISLVMIARDEADVIGRALASAAGFVDEMIVVDTGSHDDTVDVARAAGAYVTEFAWRDDFAAAKNFALSLAVMKYRLVMDADEWVVEGAAEMLDWTRSDPKCFGTVRCVSHFDAGGSLQRQEDTLVRVLPEGAAFERAIHEQPTGQYPVAPSPLVLHHDGYLERNLSRKRGRNERILRHMLSSDPSDGYSWYQLGCALASDRRYSEACDAFERALPLVPQGSPQRHPLVVRYLHSLGQSLRFEDAIEHFNREKEVWRDSPDLHFVMADVLLELGVRDARMAPVVTPMIRALLARCLEIGERPDLPGSVSGRGSDSARRNLALCPG